MTLSTADSSNYWSTARPARAVRAAAGPPEIWEWTRFQGEHWLLVPTGAPLRVFNHITCQGHEGLYSTRSIVLGPHVMPPPPGDRLALQQRLAMAQGLIQQHKHAPARGGKRRLPSPASKSPPAGRTVPPDRAATFPITPLVPNGSVG